MAGGIVGRMGKMTAGGGCYQKKCKKYELNIGRMKKNV